MLEIQGFTNENRSLWFNHITIATSFLLNQWRLKRTQCDDLIIACS